MSSVPKKPITSLATTYRGQVFRSRLEARWAQTFDSLGIKYDYEPVTFNLGWGRYQPDFYLPEFDVWAEGKGRHNERIHKFEAFTSWIDRDYDGLYPLVVLLRDFTPNGRAEWAGNGSILPVLATCPHCQRCGFMDRNGPWLCRACGEWHKLPSNPAVYYPSAVTYPFVPNHRLYVEEVAA